MTVEQRTQPSRQEAIQQNDIFLAAVMRGDPAKVRRCLSAPVAPRVVVRAGTPPARDPLGMWVVSGCMLRQRFTCPLQGEEL